MKKFLSLFLFSLLIGGTVWAAPLNGEYQGKPVVRVLVDGKTLTSEIPAYIDGGSTMLPLRAVSEALGAQITWNQETYTASITTKPAPTQPTTKPEEPKVTQEQLKKIGENVGLIYALDASGQSYGHGSGFLLDGGIFLTNYHVAGVAASVRIELNGITYTANTTVFKDEKEDLYAVRINAAGGLKISTKLPDVGSRVYAIGYPHKQFAINEGTVLYVQNYNGIDSIFHTAKTENGQSGGILVDSYGNVVGITTGSSDDFTVNQAIQMKYVQQELDKLK